MRLTTPKTHLLILGIVALAASRTVFLYIDDPEGPNLLIVTVLALPIFIVLLALRRIVLPLLTRTASPAQGDTLRP